MGAAVGLSVALGSGVYGFQELLPHEAYSSAHNREVDACANKFEKFETPQTKLPTECLRFNASFRNKVTRDVTAKSGLTIEFVFPDSDDFKKDQYWTEAHDAEIRKYHQEQAIVLSIGMLVLAGGLILRDHRRADLPDASDPHFEQELHALLNDNS
jgi:hypothetical protein